MKRETLPKSYYHHLAPLGLGNINRTGLMLYRFDKGEYICRAGEEVEYIFYIITGRCKISVTAANGRTVMFCFDIPGDILGSIEALGGYPFTATGQCVMPTECIAVPRAPNTDFFNTDVAFLNHLCHDLSAAFARSSKNAATNILYPLQTRLSSYIVMTQEDGVFSDKLTEVSELLGASYRHLLRTLDKLCADGILEKRRRGYAVLDLEELDRLAEDYYTVR